jgi:ribulose-phosphate 3-epimerase
LQLIRDGGAKAGIAINPATPAEALSTAIEFCDFVLVMSVNPGFGGQKFIEPVVPKIRHISQMVRERGLPVEIEVDGGIDERTAPLVVAAGARILVAGSAIFGKPDRTAAMQAIRSAVHSLVA